VDMGNLPAGMFPCLIDELTKRSAGASRGKNLS
jgi:hypothetical protein